MFPSYDNYISSPSHSIRVRHKKENGAPLAGLFRPDTPFRHYLSRKSLFSVFFRFHVSIYGLYIVELFQTFYHLVDSFTLFRSHVFQVVRDVSEITTDIFKATFFQMFLDSRIALRITVDSDSSFFRSSSNSSSTL